MNYLVVLPLPRVAFALFIYRPDGLDRPKTAVRGNWIAAAGMAVAVIATLIAIRHTENWPLIIAGLLVGVALGVPPARLVKMTAMPQLVAFYNGVGGGTVALIALVGVHRHRQGSRRSGTASRRPWHIVVASLFAAIIGSISFWGSIIAFGKLQEILPGRPIGVGKLQQPLNILLLIARDRGRGRDRAWMPIPAGAASLWWMIVAAGRRRRCSGLMVVLPIGGADMPVVISLLNAMTGLSAAAAGLALNNTAMIVAGMIVGASGSILTNLMAKAMNRSIPAIVAGGFGGGGVAVGGGDDGDKAWSKSTSAADAAIQMAYANQVIVVPGYGLAVAQAQHAVKDLADLLEDKGVPVKYAIHPVAGRMPGTHERAAGRGRGRLRRHEGHGRHQRRIRAHRRHHRHRRQRRHATPAARNDPSSPIHGMPILNVDQSQIGDRAQAVDELRLRRHRQPAVLRRRHHHALRRRQEVGHRSRRGAQGALSFGGCVGGNPN